MSKKNCNLEMMYFQILGGVSQPPKMMTFSVKVYGKVHFW